MREPTEYDLCAAAGHRYYGDEPYDISESDNLVAPAYQGRCYCGFKYYPARSWMGPVAQEELRRAAYYVIEALALGHQCDPGLGERIARLADVLSRTRGWTP